MLQASKIMKSYILSKLKKIKGEEFQIRNSEKFICGI